MSGDEDAGQQTPVLGLRVAEVGDASAMLQVIHQAFASRPPVDPPAAALSDTVADIELALTQGHGVIAEVDGQLAGCLLLSAPVDGACSLARVSVLPSARQHGLAAAMVRGAGELAIELGATELRLLSRREFPGTRRWWERHGFVVDHEVELGWMLRRRLPIAITVPDAEAMQRLGAALATLLRPGDLLVLNGDLGAGKTTLTQGLGLGLGVTGPIISPTFVLSRVHPNPTGAPDLVHVDAYRLGSAAELEDLDLDASLADSVTVVEWGAGLAEGLSPDRLEIHIERGTAPSRDDRLVLLDGTGARWEDAGLDQLTTAPKESLR